jgi:hypothetical protein
MRGGRAYTSAAVKRLLRNALVVCLAAWLPVQAGALPVLVLDCELDPEGAAMRQAMHGGARHDHDAASGHDHGAASGHDHDAASGHDHDAAPAHDHDGDAGHDAFGHGCCHNLSSGAAAAAPVVSPPAGTLVPVAAAIHPYRFFPDLPKRPPLADLV